MNKYVLLCASFILLSTACKSKINLLSNEEEDGKYFKDCYHTKKEVPDLELMISYSDKLSSPIQDYDSIKLDYEIELFYDYHCFECSDDDRYAYFILINQNQNGKIFRVTKAGRVEYGDIDKSIINIFFSNISVIENQYVSRDCADMDVENTDFYIKDIKKNQLISYFESIGLEGRLFDNSKNYSTQISIINIIIDYWQSNKGD